MAKFFGNLNLVLLVGLVAAIAVMACFAPDVAPNSNTVFRWLHVFFGILWIGLLYYLNFVQVPTMPTIPAELKKGVTGFIAPNVFFYFRYAALLTVITGLVVGHVSGYLFSPGSEDNALLFKGGKQVQLIGLGMWLAIVMFLNVWLIIWPAQKKILGIIEATDEEKAKATPRALAASRTNLMLSLPMLYCMANANLG